MCQYPGGQYLNLFLDESSGKINCFTIKQRFCHMSMVII